LTETWSNVQPSMAHLSTPFGQLFTQVRRAADEKVPGTLAAEMRARLTRWAFPSCRRTDHARTPACVVIERVRGEMAPTSSTSSALASDFEGFETWEAITLAVDGGMSDHNSEARSSSTVAPMGSTEFPAGTLILKQRPRSGPPASIGDGGGMTTAAAGRERKTAPSGAAEHHDPRPH